MLPFVQYLLQELIENSSDDDTTYNDSDEEHKEEYISSGIAKELFLNQSEIDIYTCGICLDIISNPKQCNFGHIFCEGCIIKAIKSKKQCPTCRNPTTLSKLSDNLFMKDKIEDLIVKCSSHLENIDEEQEDLCLWKGRYKDLQAHLGNECINHITNCPNEGCLFRLKRKDLEEHLIKCTYRMHSCLHCTNQFKYKDTETHNSTCFLYPISCDNQCGEIIPRQQMKDHLETCPLDTITCPIFPYCEVECTGHITRIDMLTHLGNLIYIHIIYISILYIFSYYNIVYI
jgi:hypothetical protein